MTVLAFLIPFLLLGAIVLYVAFSSGPSSARGRSSRWRVGGLFKVTILVVYVAGGIAVPALVLADRGDAAGQTGPLRTQKLTPTAERGKMLFRDTCWSCHSLGAAGARGVTGPNLDEIGQVTPDRVRNAIKNGGSGQNQMPKNLLTGDDAAAVSEYVARVAAR